MLVILPKGLEKLVGGDTLEPSANSNALETPRESDLFTEKLELAGRELKVRPRGLDPPLLFSGTIPGACFVKEVKEFDWLTGTASVSRSLVRTSAGIDFTLESSRIMCCSTAAIWLIGVAFLRPASQVGR